MYSSGIREKMFYGAGREQEECTPLVHSSCFGIISLGFLPRIISKAPVFRLGLKAISNLRIKKSPVL
jgi:hypothetical protein